MSRIQELIDDLCPEGVPFRPLSEIAETITGLSGKTKADFSGGNARFASYKNIFANPSLDLSANDFVKVASSEKQNSLKLGDLLVTGSSESRDEVGFTSVVTSVPQEPIYLNSFCFAVRWHSEHMLKANYVKHLFRSEAIREQIRAASNGVTRINISKPKFMKIEVPIPPIAVQEEIVRILDNFKELEAELEAVLAAELAARKQQLIEVRRQLIWGEAPLDNLTPLGEVCEVRSGWGFPIRDQGNVVGDLPFYKVSDMNHAGNEIRMNLANNYISLSTGKKLGITPAPAGTVVFPKIGAAVATNKKRVLTQDSAFDNNVMGLVPGPRVNSSFLLHFMNTLDLASLAMDSGAVPSIRKSEIERLRIPLPTIEMQLKIAEVLDHFQDLIFGVSAGLMTEIKSRRTQYEHYRDQLFNLSPWKAA